MRYYFRVWGFWGLQSGNSKIKKFIEDENGRINMSFTTSTTMIIRVFSSNDTTFEFVKISTATSMGQVNEY